MVIYNGEVIQGLLRNKCGIGDAGTVLMSKDRQIMV